MGSQEVCLVISICYLVMLFEYWANVGVKWVLVNVVRSKHTMSLTTNQHHTHYHIIQSPSCTAAQNHHWCGAKCIPAATLGSCGNSLWPVGRQINILTEVIILICWALLFEYTYLNKFVVGWLGAVSVKLVWFCWNWARNIGFVVHEDWHKPLWNTNQANCSHVQYTKLLDWCWLILCWYNWQHHCESEWYQWWGW